MKYEYGRQVRKRDGRLVLFERSKIADAIFRAAKAVGGEDRFLAEQLSGIVAHRVISHSHGIPTIEDIQDAVEKVLIEAGHARTAKAYILYRDRRTQARASRHVVGEGEHAEIEGTLIGGGDATLRRFSKTEISKEIAQLDGLDQRTAEDVARAVEDRVLRSSFKRVSQQTLVSLVRAELFDRGQHTRYGEAAVLSDARHAARRALEGHASVSGDPLGVADTPRTRAVREASPPSRVARRPHAIPRTAARANPGARLEWLGEHVLGSHILAGELSPAAVEAHQLGDLHFYDVGSPFRLTALSLNAVTACTPLLAGEEFSRARAPARAFDALSSAILAYAPLTSRGLSLEHVNVFLAPFVDHLDPITLAESIRAFLMSPALVAPRLGASAGRAASTTIELLLSETIPPWLRDVATPAPAAPGRTFGDFGDVARHVGKLMIHELDNLRRRRHRPAVRLGVVVTRASTDALIAESLLEESQLEESQLEELRIEESRIEESRIEESLLAESSTPSHGRHLRAHDANASARQSNRRAHDPLSTHLGAEPDHTSAGHTLRSEGLRHAAHGGDLAFAIDETSIPRRGPMWFRVAEHEVRDPFRFARGDVTVASLAAINLRAIANRVGSAGVDDFIREAKRVLTLALEGAEFRRTVQRDSSSLPGGALYGIRREHEPLVDLDGAFHVLELVGLDVCKSLGDEHARGDRIERVRRELAAALSHEGAARDVRVALIENAHDEACARFASLDLVRFSSPDQARERQPMGAPRSSAARVQEKPTNRRAATASEGTSLARSRLGLSSSVARLDAYMPAGRLVTYELRVNGEAPPSHAELRTHLDRALSDPSAYALRVTPWPRRSIHRDVPPSGGGV